MNRKYLLRTLGCKVNQYESQQIRELIESHGWRPARPSEVADLAVINGCAVTTSAAAKTRQAVRRAAAGGSVPVVVIGCAAAADAERLRSIPGVVALVKHTDQVAKHLHHYLVHNQHGNLALPSGKTCADASATDGPACLSTFEPDCKGAVAITPVTPAEPPGFLAAHRYPDGSIPACGEDVNAADQPNDHLPPITRFDNRTRAFLKVQDGCDAFCSFCIVPRLRPQLHFKPVEAAVAEATALVAAGHKEIVLSGIYLGAYGRPTARRNRFEADGRSPLAELVAAIAAVPGLQRLRLSSLEPGDLDDALLDVLASHACCVPHLHLPLQSGSSQILKRMNRQYDADDFTTMIDRVANRLYQPAITTDVVVGFPGETDEDFEQTLAIARYAGFCKIHAFPFSPRPGTTAAKWRSEFVPGDLVHQRLAQLNELEAVLADAYRRQFIGTVQRVLVERSSRQPESRDNQPDSSSETLWLRGRTDRYFEVWFPAVQQLETIPWQLCLGSS